MPPLESRALALALSTGHLGELDSNGTGSMTNVAAGGPSGSVGSGGASGLDSGADSGGTAGVSSSGGSAGPSDAGSSAGADALRSVVSFRRLFLLSFVVLFPFRYFLKSFLFFIVPLLF